MFLFGDVALYTLNIKLNTVQARLVQVLENKLYISAFNLPWHDFLLQYFSPKDSKLRQSHSVKKSELEIIKRK